MYPQSPQVMVMPQGGNYPQLGVPPFAGTQSVPQAAQDAYEILSRSLPPGLRVAAIYIASDDVNESNWALQQLNNYLMNSRRYSVIDPYRCLELVNNYPYYTRGQVLPPEAAIAIGNSLGAQAVIVGSIIGYNQGKYINLQAIDARTGANLAVATGRMPFYYGVPGTGGISTVPLQGSIYQAAPVTPLMPVSPVASPIMPVNPVVTTAPRYYYY
jgi:hypothetical protein